MNLQDLQYVAHKPPLNTYVKARTPTKLKNSSNLVLQFRIQMKPLQETTEECSNY